jgi:hypothetical protein
MLFKSLSAAALAASSLLLPGATQSGRPSNGAGIDSVQKILRSVIGGRTSTRVSTSGRASTRASASVHIPRGQLPPAGLCRVWIQGVPPGRQPAVTDCATAEAQAAQTANARVIYGDQQSFPGKGKGSVQRRNGGDDENGVGRGDDGGDENGNGGVLGGGDDNDQDEGNGSSGVLGGGQINGRAQGSAAASGRGGRPTWAGSNGRGHGRGHGG